MDESDEPKHLPPEPPTPEVDALIKMLEIQAALRRERRIPAPSAFQAPSFRYGILIAIIVITFGSLWALEWVLSQIPRPPHPAAAAAPAATVAIAKTGTLPGGPAGKPPYKN
jgi:hypothetical protein